MTKIQSYLELGKQEGAECLIGGARAELEGELAGGYYIQPTCSKATIRCGFSKRKSSGQY